MSEGVPYADIIILALIAGFILLRLRSVLGQKTGDDDFLERPRPPTTMPARAAMADKFPKTKPKEDKDNYLSKLAEGEVKTALSAIKAKDAQFSATQFMQGAKSAFEMVLDGFAKGDKPPLKMLLADSLYNDLCAEIDARASQDSRLETTLVSVAPKEITKASLTGNLAQVSVKFLSEQIAVTRNAQGEIIGGNPSEPAHVEDIWTFERDVTAKNPNWKIIET